MTHEMNLDKCCKVSLPYYRHFPNNKMYYVEIKKGILLNPWYKTPYPSDAEITVRLIQ